MANLSITELGKRNNYAIFAEKVRKGIPFVYDGKEVKIGYKSRAKNNEWAKNIESMGDAAFTLLKNSRGSIILPTTDGKDVPLTGLYKGAEFGGAGAGSRTAKEDAQLVALNKALEEIMKKSKTSYVPVKVLNTVHKVVKAESTPGTPKSDFHLVDVDGNECVWISHKDGRSEKDFSQWGGMSEKEATVYRHPEVQKFINDIKKSFPDGIPKATTVARKIRDNKLKNLAVFGVDYGKKLGRQNVSVLLQGSVGLAASGKSYKLTASAHVEYNGETPDGNYEPILSAMHKCDRSQFGIKCGRFSIYTLGGRKITQWI